MKELKAKDLRIGNFVTHNYFPTEPKAVTGFKAEKSTELIFINDPSFDVINIEQVKPIPLTEEWLLKLGFDKLISKSKGFKSDSYTYTGKCCFIVNFDGKRLWTNFWQGTEYEYVHQLQNLFYALTGTELTIK